MKKTIVTIALILVVACLTGCKEKRCKCITNRYGELPAVGLEPLGSHKDCSELDAQWTASDSTSDILTKKCTPEEV